MAPAFCATAPERREITAQKPVVRGRDRELSAQEVEPLVRTQVFADREVEGRPVTRGQRRGPAAVMHDVPWVAGKQKDVAGL